MSNALANTCDSGTGELLRPEELTGLGEKIQWLSTLLSEHIMQMQEQLDELVELFEELRKGIQESRRQRILQFLQKLFNVLGIVLTGVTALAPVRVLGVGVLAAVGAGIGATLFCAAAKVCKRAEQGS